MTYKLLGISGALRAESTNTKLIHEAVRLFGDADLTMADLKIPLYDGDDEAASGVPASAQTLAAQIAAADAILISTPEYNGGIPGVLKNALDWVSRMPENPWLDKPVAVMSAAAGVSGAPSAQSMLRVCMVPFRARIANGSPYLLGKSYSQFDDNGQLGTERYRDSLTALMQVLKADMS